MTTMAEVAREAGVSTTTVSHVINGTRPVNVKTAERVNAAISRTGYRPHSIAQALAGARTRSVGLAISGISNPYFMDVIGAIEAEASEHGHSLLLADTHDEPGKELQMVRELVGRRVDGLLLAPSPQARTGVLSYLADQPVAVVLLDRFLPVEFDQVGTENKEATAQLVEHLARLGHHRRIALIAGLKDLSTTKERIKGYRLGLQRSGLPQDAALIEDGESQHAPARTATHRLLELKDRPTALIAANNAMTIGAMRALHEHGLSVPRDIALVGFDDFVWADLFQPRLTVIAQPTREIGQRAVQLLLQRLAEPGRPPQRIRLKPTLIHRESCGCPNPTPATG